MKSMNGGVDPGFKLGGVHSKNCTERREARKCLGYFVWKITILRKKIIFFPNFRGGGGARAPGFAPEMQTAISNVITFSRVSMYLYKRYAWTLSDTCIICHMYLFKVEEHILTVFTFSQHSLWQVQKYYVKWNIFHSILNSLVYDLDFIFAFINDILILLLYNVNNYILIFLNTVQSMHLERISFLQNIVILNLFLQNIVN